MPYDQASNASILFLLIALCASTACAPLSTPDADSSSSAVAPTEDISQNIESNATTQAATEVASPSLKKSNRSEEVSSTRSPQMMSSHLSSRAKRAVLLSPPDKVLSVMLTVSPRMSRDELTAEIEQVGGSVITWSEETHLVNANLPAGALESISKHKGVHYVETGGRYGKN